MANIGELSAQHSAVNIEKEDKEIVLEIVKDLGEEVNEVQLWYRAKCMNGYDWRKERNNELIKRLHNICFRCTVLNS